MVGVVCLTMRPVSVEREAKVRDLEMSRCANQKVVWLDIAVNPVHLVSLIDAKYHLCHILPGNSFVEYVLSQEQTQEVAADHVFHDKVEIGVVLETCD